MRKFASVYVLFGYICIKYDSVININDRIKEKRLVLKISQSEIAAKLGISRKKYIAIEAGKISLNDFLAICKILNWQISVSEVGSSFML